MNAIPGYQDNLLNRIAGGFLLRRTYFPAHNENLMAHEGDLELARKRYLETRPHKLTHLLEHRFAWMNEFTEGKARVVEIGAGTGLTKFFIKNPNFKLTDYAKYPWIDEEVDAMNLPWGDNTIDVIVSSHMIHHLYSPAKFFKGALRVLKPGGLLLIQEINTSFLMRAMLRIMRHEGWSYDIDVFDENAVANDPKDPWSANCAIPQLLFSDSTRFEGRFPEYKVLLNKPCECLIFPLSGGVIARAGFLAFDIPRPVLRLVDGLDKILIGLLPEIFALGRSVVLEKRVR